MGDACGFVLFKPPYTIGQSTVPAAIYRSHVYYTALAAQKALDGIVWHSRDGWEIRPIVALEPAAPRCLKHGVDRQLDCQGCEDAMQRTAAPAGSDPTENANG